MPALLRRVARRVAGRRVVGLVRTAVGLPPVRTYRHRLTRMEREYDDVWTYTLEPVRPRDRISFTPGQYLHLIAPGARVERPWVRHMSIASLPGKQVVISMDLASNSEYKERFRSVRAGDEIAVFGIAGSFTFTDVPAAAGIVFIAGGIGITPIHCLARTLIGDPRPWELVHIGRNHLYRKELEAIAPESRYTGRDGVPGELDRLVRNDDGKRCYFVSGSHEFVLAISDTLRRSGIDERRIKIEDFSH